MASASFVDFLETLSVVMRATGVPSNGNGSPKEDYEMRYSSVERGRLCSLCSRFVFLGKAICFNSLMSKRRPRLALESGVISRAYKQFYATRQGVTWIAYKA
jgi:hypothetical protein